MLERSDKITLSAKAGWLLQRPVYHAAFWLLCWFVLVLIDLVRGSALGQSLVGEGINLLFFAAIVYVNLEYLIPHYLTRSRFLNYLGLLAATAIIVTPLKIMFLYFYNGSTIEVLAYLRQNQIYYFFSSFIFAFGSTFLRMMTDWLRHLQEKRELERRQIQSELNFLKAQINPHFLFNTLNSLYALTLRKSDLAPEIVVKLSEMLRYMLYECNEPLTNLSKELLYVQGYLDLEKLRHGDRVEVQLSVDGNADGLMIAPLLLTPFIENAFKHGTMHAVEKGFVHIHVYLDQARIKLEVTNSKPPHQPAQRHPRSGGIGLNNVRRRLDMLYPGRHTLLIDDAPNNYAVQLVIDLKSESQSLSHLESIKHLAS
jgi:hypothetical protein